MEGSTAVKGNADAARNGILKGEDSANTTTKETNGYALQKTAKKSAARGKNRLGTVFSLLWYSWFVLECLLYYAVFFVVVVPLVPLVAVFFLLKMVERVVVKLTRGENALSGQDAVWQQTRDENRLVINAVVYVERKNSFDDAVNDFRQLVLERMVNAKKPSGDLLYPRIRCCIRPGFFQYFFQEDKSFRIENHVFKWEGDPPSSKEELASIASKLSNEAFPEGLSPWYFCCVPINYGEQGFAAVFRVTHSLADGVALTKFLINQLPDKSTPQKEPVKFTASTSKALLLAKAGLILPRFFIKLFLSFADRSILHGPRISGAKKLAWHEGFELELVKQIKTATGTTVNDVLMSCLSRAIRRYFQRKGVENPPDFTASVPVDIRLSPASKKDLRFQNKFSLIFLKLAAATEDVLEQLQTTKARMDECKLSGEYLAIAAMIILTNELTPEFVVSNISDFIAQKTSCVLSNVPGPQNFLTVNGQRIKYITFWPPQRHNIAVGLSIYTYAGQVIVGVQSDASLLRDPEVIIEEFGNAVKDLADRVLHGNEKTEHAVQ